MSEPIPSGPLTHGDAGHSLYGEPGHQAGALLRDESEEFEHELLDGFDEEEELDVDEFDEEFDEELDDELDEDLEEDEFEDEEFDEFDEEFDEMDEDDEDEEFDDFEEEEF